MTASSRSELHPDDRLLAQALRERGCDAQLAAWDDATIGWRSFDVAVLRSAWNYHLRPDAFASWIDSLESAGIALVNPVATVRWNLHKRYLLDLIAAGVPVVATQLVQAKHLRERLAEAPWDEIVIKPAISASAYHTYRLRRGERLPDEVASEIRDHQDWVVQPFVRSVAEHGERSAVCIDGRVSHVVRKIARGGDFRVQSDFGGTLVGETSSVDHECFITRVLDALPVRWVYARVDWAADPDPRVMEVELIEPELFLARDIPSAARLADAVLREVG